MCVCVCTQSLSCVQLFEAPWTVAHQAPLSMGFSRQEYWSGLPFPTPGDLPNLGMEPEFLASPALAGRFFTISAAWGAPKKAKGTADRVFKVFQCAHSTVRQPGFQYWFFNLSVKWDNNTTNLVNL